METLRSLSLNKTFSSNDILRIMQDHLTPEEKDEVICAILISTRKLGGYASGLGLLRAIIRFISPKTRGDILRQILGGISDGIGEKYDADY